MAVAARLHVVSWSIVPLIVLAQLCCWDAVISLNHLGHAIEEILWSVLAFLAAVSGVAQLVFRLRVTPAS